MKIFFQSSMPRSGSTLLQNIIGQRPEFYVTPTSGLYELMLRARNGYSSSAEVLAQDSEQMKAAFKSFCRAGAEGYFSALTDREYVVDKSRAWIPNYNFLSSIYDDVKIVCIIRHPAEVFASMEKAYRKNGHVTTAFGNTPETSGATIESRVSFWSQTNPVGVMFENIRECINNGSHKNILFIRYEELLSNPQEIMDVIYKYLGVDTFEHDFDNIQQVTHENDAIHGIYGDHNIRGKLEAPGSNAVEILGEHVCSNIKNGFEWFYSSFNYV